MALKRKINKAAFDALSDAFKAEYKEQDGEYVLDVDGIEDTSALKRAKDRETQARKDAEKKADELQEQLDGISDKDSRKRGDIEALEKSWKTKEATTKTEYEGKISKLTEHVKKTLIDGTASTIAGKISTVPTLMAKAIKDRLTVDFDGDEPTLRILGADGKISAMTTDDLSKEFIANKEYSGIIVGSKASGGGAAKDGFSKQTAGGGQQTQTDKPALFSKMSPADLAAHIKENISASKE